MARKYDINLVHTIREKQYTEIRRDVPVIIKPIRIVILKELWILDYIKILKKSV